MMMSSMIASFVASAIAAPTSLDTMVLATFGDKSKTDYKWAEQNDPVMGGQSYGSWSVDTSSPAHGVFTGQVKNVSFLHAPGFCRTTTVQPFFTDASAYLEGGLQLQIRTLTPQYAGFRFAFSAVGVPTHNGGHELLGSFKSSFSIPPSSSGGGYDTVYLPFHSFSWDWSDFTGECSTKDPDGYQHRCCGTDHPEVCPTAKQLAKIDGFSLWAEGAEGNFTVDILSVSAVMSGPDSNDCAGTEFCCPDAKACLTPTGVSCAKDASTCSAGQVCCPLIKQCVAVGVACDPSPAARNVPSFMLW